jgi:hypothetical protein
MRGLSVIAAALVILNVVVDLLDEMFTEHLHEFAQARVASRFRNDRLV